MALEGSINRAPVLGIVLLLHQIAIALGTPSPYPHPTLAPPKAMACGTYGAPTACAFVPAAPGLTPRCASPGSTFCETNPDYPTYLIAQLVEMLGFQRIVTNEEQIDFDSHKPIEEEEHLHHHYHHFYGSFSAPETTSEPVTAAAHPQGYVYNRPPGNNHLPVPVPQPIYIPKPQHSYSYNAFLKPAGSHRHSPSQASGGAGHQGYSFYPQPGTRPSSQSTQYSPADWLRRFARDLSDQRGREARIAALRRVDESVDPSDAEPTPFRLPAAITTTMEPLLNETTYARVLRKARARRQATVLRETLCSVREKYITPQTALNTKGNWMFVVNQENSRQLVKTEVCSSTECSNLCSFPIGYSSRCEQRYVQKRLVTLDPSGRTLYVDTYWFPSCCVCSLHSGN